MMAGRGRLVMVVMALALAVMACRVRFEGVPTPPAMTRTPQPATATATPAMTATPVMAGACLVVHASPGDDGALNLRTGPGVKYPVLIALPDGQVLEMMSSGGDWYKVRVGMEGRALVGYVRANYVRACD